jgi:hypothetical protein
MFLDAAGIPLSLAWLMLYPRIVQDDFLITCGPLVNWFQVALMRKCFIITGAPVLNAANQQLLTSSQSFHYLNGPGADAPLVHHQLALLHQISRLFKTQLSSLMPRAWLREPMLSLLLASHELSEAYLTPFWHVMACTPKQHGMAFMKDAYSQRPHHFNLPPWLCLVASTLRSSASNYVPVQHLP